MVSVYVAFVGPPALSLRGGAEVVVLFLYGFNIEISPLIFLVVIIRPRVNTISEAVSFSIAIINRSADHRPLLTLNAF